ncbi:hypothetical protein ACHAPD_007800 [Fusarium lateritium]
MAAAHAMLDEIHETLPMHVDDSNAYILGNIKQHNIVVACLPEGRYGLNNAANVLTHLVRTFSSIRAGLMVGIGGGVPSKTDIRLGDIVVGTRVMQYDLGKIVGDGQMQHTAIPKISQQLLGTAVSSLRARHEREGSRILSILREKFKEHSEYRRPASADCLFLSTYDHVSQTSACDECDHSKLVRRRIRETDDPLIHYGAIASGNQVMRSGTQRDSIARQLDVICFEMEAAGLMDILPCLPIRGICDYLDSHKNKEWQRYAAAAAASYARELLTVLPVAEARVKATYMPNPSDQECSTGPVVRSLATEIHGRSQSVTVTFQNASYYLQAIPAGQTRSILLPRSSENQSIPPGYLALDGDFFGITTLYAPPLDDHKVDVIAISGLGGHAFGSFKERGGDYMWLRDSLPSAITKDTGEPMARVMIYGYESSIAQSKSIETLECLATSFRDSLLPLANSQMVRPIILVGHSLGGLIIKQVGLMTLILLSKSKTEEYIRLVRAVYGIVFFGVPHDGMDISSLIPMVGDGPNRFLVESISHINSQLSIQQQEFHKSLGDKGDMEIVCFYETLESQTAKKDENGNWTMDGPAAILVTKSSATHCRQWEDAREHICRVARTHSDIVKFGPHDHEYDKVRARLERLVRRALTARHQVQNSNAQGR